jgi:hypothetical protein
LHLLNGVLRLISERSFMPEKKTLERARRDKARGKAPSTQAGEFVREEMEHIRAGKHGARSSKQAIAIGLSKARRAGVKLRPPKNGTVSEKTRRSAQREYDQSQPRSKRQASRPSAKRSRATLKALKREGRSAASHSALSRQAKSAAKKRTRRQRSTSAKKAARTRSR